MERRTHTRTRTAAVLAAALLPLSLLPAMAGASGPPDHGHAMLHHVEMVPNPGYNPNDPTSGPPVFVTDYSRCVDLANARKLPLHVHHDNIHTGAAGAAIRDRSPHLVIPLAPLTDYESCADIDAEYKD